MPLGDSQSRWELNCFLPLSNFIILLLLSPAYFRCQAPNDFTRQGETSRPGKSKFYNDFRRRKFSQGLNLCYKLDNYFAFLFTAKRLLVRVASRCRGSVQHSYKPQVPLFSRLITSHTPSYIVHSPPFSYCRPVVFPHLLQIVRICVVYKQSKLSTYCRSQFLAVNFLIKFKIHILQYQFR